MAIFLEKPSSSISLCVWSKVFVLAFWRAISSDNCRPDLPHQTFVDTIVLLSYVFQYIEKNSYLYSTQRKNILVINIDFNNEFGC